MDEAGSDVEATIAAIGSGSIPETAPQRLTDEELIARSQAGEEATFAEFVRRHTPLVYRWMARAVGEQDAEDLTQEVFLRTFRGLPRYRGQAPPRAWLAAIADNAIKNRYRSRSRFRRIFAPEAAEESNDSTSPHPSPEENARTGESRATVRNALQKLPLEFRLPVVLRDLEEWSYEEIAASLDLPIGTVKSRIARGRGQLRAILAPLFAGETRQ